MVLFDRFKRPASQVRKANQSKLDSLIAIGFAPLNLLFDGLTRTFAFTRLVRLEVMLLLKGWPNGWYLLVLTLVIAQCLVNQSGLVALFYQLLGYYVWWYCLR